MDDWYGNVSLTNSGMLVMPTGTGKTRVAASLIINSMRRAYESNNRINHSVLWIAHTKELIEQAYETFKKMWVNEGAQGRTLKLTRFYDEIDAGELLDNWGVVVSSIQKIHESIKEEGSPSSRIIKNRVVPNLRLVVIDEAHLAENPSYNEVLDFLSRNTTFSSTADNGWKLLGLTATPFKSDDKRTEKLNQMFAKRFQLTKNEDLADIERYGVYDWFKKKRYMSHDVRYVPLSLPERTFTLRDNEKRHFQRFQNLHKTTLARLALDDYRNEYIIKEIKRAIAKGSRKILLFSCSVPHCYLLHALLNSEGIESNFVIGKMTRRERDENINSFRKNKDTPIVLINYAILTTGFDDPDIDTVVITRPTASRVLYHQMIGRGLRGEKNGGNKGGICRIYDVKDNFDEFEGFNVIDYDKEISEMSDY
jgi:superfamily II DNA or RNA helicase